MQEAPDRVLLCIWERKASREFGLEQGSLELFSNGRSYFDINSCLRVGADTAGIHFHYLEDLCEIDEDGLGNGRLVYGGCTGKALFYHVRKYRDI